MADTLKCPNCGSNLTLNADTQMLDCPNCGSTFDPATLAVTVEELEAKPAEPDVLTQAPAADQTAQTQPGAQPQGAPEQTEFVCNACGAKLVTDAHTAATFCAFCGSPALVGKRLTEQFQPQYMIPFKYSRSAAEAAFIKWAGKGKWTPFGFVSKKNVQKMTGLYVPFWLFNIRATIDASGTGDKIHYSGDDEIIETFSFKRNAQLSWSHVPLDGETRIDDALMEAIEPFDFDSLIPYDYRYLPGFYADRYDQSPQDLSARATKRGMDGIDKALKSSLKGTFDRFRIKENKSRIDSMEANYALLPVWFLSYKYMNKYYYFAMNGQTGEVAGQIPVSPVKKMMFFFIVLGILAVITRFVLGLIMRGFWG
ncbi:MAG: TFIIB-type zinc ribbon-containing protein [Clostridiales bacterium]|nr:TFIIB-type zinc ribbon-containing protein [Clostridiales bacterium]